MSVETTPCADRVVSIQCKFSNDAVVLDQEESASLAMEVIVSSSRIRSKLWGLEEFKFFGFELFLRLQRSMKPVQLSVRVAFGTLRRKSTTTPTSLG